MALFLAAALFWRPHGGRLQVFGGPGVEFVDAEHHATPVTPVARSSAEADDDSESALRLSAGYDVPIGKPAVRPLISADVIDGHTTGMNGVALGVGF